MVRGLDGKRVTHVSCSYYHSIVACESGEVYSFGRNDHGQLGHGDTIDRKIPQLIESLKGHAIASLACGQYHTMVATKEGKLFSSGKNDYGQLGLESSDGVRVMTVVGGCTMENVMVTDIRCGYYHTVILCEGGHVYGFGRNDYGQIGLGHIAQRVYGPQLIEAMEGKGVVRIAAGCYHTVLVGRNGMLYVCGRNNHGQLGTGDTNERHLPHPIDLFLGKRVAMVSAGFYHTIVLTGGVECDPLVNTRSCDFATYGSSTLLKLSSFTLPPGLDDKSPKGVLTCSAKGLPEDDLLQDEQKSDQPSCESQQSPWTGLALEQGPEKPNSDRFLCNPDGTVAPEKAALYVLAQIDRLASLVSSASVFPTPMASHLHRGRGPELLAVDGNTTTQGDCYDELLGQGKSLITRTHCVDVSPEMFELLLCLLIHLHEEDSSSLLNDVDLGNDSEKFVHAYGILACLRIIRVNMVQLLNHPVSLKLREMLGRMKRYSDSFDDLAPFEEYSMLVAPHSHVFESFKSNTLSGKPLYQVILDLHYIICLT